MLEEELESLGSPQPAALASSSTEIVSGFDFDFLGLPGALELILAADSGVGRKLKAVSPPESLGFFKNEKPCASSSSDLANTLRALQKDLY